MPDLRKQIAQVPRGPKRGALVQFLKDFEMTLSITEVVMGTKLPGLPEVQVPWAKNDETTRRKKCEGRKRITGGANSSSLASMTAVVKTLTKVRDRAKCCADKEKCNAPDIWNLALLASGQKWPFCPCDPNTVCEEAPYWMSMDVPVPLAKNIYDIFFAKSQEI